MTPDSHGGYSPPCIYAREGLNEGPMRIRLHKILNEGRSVRFEKDDNETLDVNVIVFKDPKPARPRSE